MKVFRSQVVSSFCEKPWKKQCAGSIRKEGVTRDETGRWPRRLEDWVEADNPVRAIEAYIETLDLSSLGFDRTQPNRTAAGQPAYAPADILKLYLYGYLNRVRSSRGLARECQRNLEVIWLLKGLRPTYKTIADFRMRNAQALPKVHTGFIAVCKDLKWLGGEQVAVDGSHKQRYAASSNDCRACPLKDRCLPPPNPAAAKCGAMDIRFYWRPIVSAWRRIPASCANAVPWSNTHSAR